MARTASGTEHKEAAYALLHSARTADELRLAQAVLLPLEWGLTAMALGATPDDERYFEVGGANRGRTNYWPHMTPWLT